MKYFNKNSLNILILLLLTAISGSQSIVDAQNEPQPRRKSLEEIVNMPVVYTIPEMDKVRVKKDVVYKSDAGVQLKMDVYAPPDTGKREKRPVVFFIHGGTPLENRPKDWGVFASWGKLVAASGMIGVVFTHRMGFPKQDFALAESDLTDAIGYVRQNADTLNADKERIALVSFSAGGPLLSVAMRDAPPFVRALVAFYSFLDVRESEMHRRAIADPEVLRKYSPITYLAATGRKLPPILVARAGLDEIPGLNAAADRFVAEALSQNIAVEVMNHPNGVHGFDNQTDDARSKQIVGRALEFLKTNLNQAGVPASNTPGR